MFLEIATTIGAISGAYLAASTPTRAIAIIFGIVLLYSAYSAIRPPKDLPTDKPPDRYATLLKFDGSYPTPGGESLTTFATFPRDLG